MKITRLFSVAAIMVAALALTSCNNKKFHINGNITEAQDSMLYLENISLNGPVKIDSVKLGEDGAFAFDEAAMDSVTPEFYRLRIANQTINLSIDSTETVKVKAAYPQMSFKYEVEGSENCNKIKELSLKQMTLQSNINGLVKDPNIGNDSIESIVGRMLQAYKQDIKTNYIFKEPMKAYAYYALFQTVQLGNVNTLIFNPRNNKDDVKVFAAVATSWDTYYPGAERGKNLHNIAIEGMKDIRIIVPSKTMTEVAHLLPNDDEEPVYICANRRYVVFMAAGYTIMSRLIEGEFLNYHNVIPSGSRTRVTLDTKEFIETIERASLIITERLKNPLRISFTNGKVVVRCQTNLGRVVDEFRAECEGEEVEIGFNNRYLLDALRNARTEQVKMEISGPLSPVKVLPAEGNDFLYLVLPVRFKND